MHLFTASDVLKFAVRVEEDGELFYHKAATFAESDDVRRLFNQLADEEIRHRRIFQNMLDEVGEYRPPESYPGEYMTYLRAFIDNRAVFTKKAKDQAGGISDTLAALDFAIQRELDSVVYYQEAKQFVPQKHYKFIDSIIEEERKHFAVLSEIKQKYQSK
jgi:rubrerythrin